MIIYFDHSATTPVDEKVMKAMLPYFSNTFGNASSIHTFGQEALSGVDKARQQAADFLHCSVNEIVFTSGATESDNLAIKGFANALRKKGKQYKDMHMITSLVEHDAVLETFKELEKKGVSVTYIKVQKNGVVDLDDLQKVIKDNTVLVSIMWVNSEVGAIMPIREIGKTIKKINDKRESDWKKMRVSERGIKPEPIIFHTDATQAVNFLNCDVKWNYIDMLSMSGHKIYGPKGVGLLYKKQGVPLLSLQKGGHHENNLRSGTLNVTGIVGMGAALSLLGTGEMGEASEAQKNNNLKISKVRDYLAEKVLKNIPDAILNTDITNSTPSHAHFSLLGIEGESILLSLDLEGVAVSTGSACASGSLKPSHVLLAMGIAVEVAHNSVRITLGKNNTKAEVDKFIKALIPICERLRKMNPLYKK
ncbi:MAG: Cysteine desulfurase [Candidatus Falkowbacteria bacterium GW2011_GWC2_38_22]|uniref:cysteine desulfurase n=1 Tax=Candidatus Falkowbacteria bacterium GW2011_GWE1_38_31 TaxID=1618638 RepID=A0A0G0JT33_9BACT|nr:MAG: Cysteine desulfurase [Candidatus Falkowbacteria bacterium GW2011_GWF2_38_1205]KKQ61625.1 MAG: Cysteine desulfurase [Candidatus Falkowbacteria bacterium GW2011_GWC2_38_22]KKQ63760.1 MAG: Cysteine desulfurase [Candidatus Falkowbacteria bacterium GW2011_GWF1_38_22]KKQ65824.1 MAG: Cysteine desulfurase [Candidatus Falkowbacteria bacterium GW2011_GWE2_38_254]KKQ70623.1 MAG: Cysteine desulfurase [Candidatus Falkowbacteria bacterium GW2011_GWE1_38_31]KKQ73019.1 MAG: Cysteine desulfurase [Candi